MTFIPPPTITGIPQDDLSQKVLPIRSLPQNVDRISFAKNISNNIDSEWGALVGSIGTGMTVNQTGGNLVITSGTTARSETIIRSALSWEGGVRLRVRSTLSQRIVNNNFFAELVDVIGDGLAYSIGSATAITVTIPSSPFTADNVGQSMYIGGFSGTGTFLSGRYPIASVSGDDVTFTVSAFAAGTGTCSLFGWNYYQLLYTGTTATQASFDTQRKGYASGATTATINTTASPGHLAIITGNDLAAAFADQLVASVAGTIQQSVRATRAENVPDDFPLRMQLRVANGSTAPASTTTWTIGFVSVSNYANQDVSVQDVRSMGTATGLPIEILRSIALAATQSGTWTVMPGNTANTTPWLANPLIPAVSTTGDTGAKTTTGNGATQTNATSKGANIVLNLGTVTGTTPTLVLKIQGSADGGTTWVDIPGANTASITATGAYGIQIYPGTGAVAGVATAGTMAVINAALPRTWRVVWTIGGTTPSFTITNIQVSYLI